MATENQAWRLASLVLTTVLLGAGGCTWVGDKSVYLAREGQAQAVIVVAEEADEVEKLAAQEIADYVEQISGARLAIVSDAEPVQPEIPTRILIGSAARRAVPDLNVQRVLSEQPNSLLKPEGFVLRVEQGTVAVCGVNPRGTLHGAYDLLERMGCRWFFPGDLGEVIPSRTTIALEPFETVQRPSLEFRFILKSGEGSLGYAQNTPNDENGNTDEIYLAWARRNRLSLDRSWWKVSHSITEPLTTPGLVDRQVQQALEYFDENPQEMMFSLCWADARHPIEADDALGVPHPWGKVYQAVDPMVSFNNQVAERVLAKYPNKLFCFLVYQNYIGAPIRYKPHPSTQPIIATIEQCPRHVPGTGQCWQRDAVNRLVKDWCSLSDKVIVYEYMPGFLVDGSVPMPDVTRIRAELPQWIRWGLCGMYTQSQLSIMNTGPNSYVRAKLFWNAQADVDALLDEYYAMLFGPAARPVRAYWDALEYMMHHGTGYQHEDEVVKVIYPLDKIRKLETHILQAEAAADTGPVRRRVQMIRLSFDNLMLYLRMREAEDQADFAAAKGLGQELLDLHHRIEQINPVFYKIGDLDRANEQEDHLTEGWIRQNDQRNQRINGRQGDLVVMLPEEWSFKTDPNNQGIIYRWFDADFDAGQWNRLRTSRVWEVQGLEDQTGHGYDGIGWYRTTTHVPAKFAGQQIKLNFGGVFGKMLIWINGEFITYRPFKVPWWHNAYNQTFDVDVSSAIKPGQENTIVVRVDNEHEWGGIFRRVFLWSPLEAEKKE